MRLTERYIELCRELAAAGYVWEPRPGDWMLDRDDGSIGMLTTYIERPELLRRANLQVPYGDQIREMLSARKCTVEEGEGGWCWRDRDGSVLHRAEVDPEAEDEEALAALVAEYLRHGV